MTTRLVKIPGLGSFEVPRHISRVDSDRGWHGWQVRWPDFRQWFSDAAHGDAWASLDAAVACVRHHYPGKRTQCVPGAGVRLHTKFSRRGVEVYAEASHPLGRASKRVYVGLLGTTATHERWERAERKARACRREMVRLHVQERGLVPARG